MFSKETEKGYRVGGGIWEELGEGKIIRMKTLFFQKEIFIDLNKVYTQVNNSIVIVILYSLKFYYRHM